MVSTGNWQILLRKMKPEKVFVIKKKTNLNDARKPNTSQETAINVFLKEKV